MKAFLAFAGAYVGLVILANWMASAYVWTVPLTALVAPAGVFAIGIVLVLRDWGQQRFGLVASLPLIPAAGALSWVVGNLAGWTSLQKIAIASVVAFICSELVEVVVFTPVRNRNLSVGVLLSGVVGNMLDSYIFLTIAFGSLAFFGGQFVAKMEMVVVGTVLTVWRRAWMPVSVKT